MTGKVVGKVLKFAGYGVAIFAANASIFDAINHKQESPANRQLKISKEGPTDYPHIPVNPLDSLTYKSFITIFD